MLTLGAPSLRRLRPFRQVCAHVHHAGKPSQLPKMSCAVLIENSHFPPQSHCGGPSVDQAFHHLSIHRPIAGSALTLHQGSRHQLADLMALVRSQSRVCPRVPCIVGFSQSESTRASRSTLSTLGMLSSERTDASVEISGDRTRRAGGCHRSTGREQGRCPSPCPKALVH